MVIGCGTIVVVGSFVPTLGLWDIQYYTDNKFNVIQFKRLTLLCRQEEHTATSITSFYFVSFCERKPRYYEQTTRWIKS